MQEPIQSQPAIPPIQSEIQPITPKLKSKSKKLIYISVAILTIIMVVLLIPLQITCGSTGKTCTPPPDSDGYITQPYSTKPLGIVLLDTIFNTDLPIKYTSGTTSTQVNYDINEGELKTCEYNGETYTENDSFDSTDGCNTCGCSNGQVICTLIECENDIILYTATPQPITNSETLTTRIYEKCSTSITFDNTSYTYEEDISFRQYFGDFSQESRVFLTNNNTGNDNVQSELLISCSKNPPLEGEDTEMLFEALQERWNNNNLNYTAKIIDKNFKIGNTTGYKIDFTFNSPAIGTTTEHIYITVYNNKSYVLRTINGNTPDSMLNTINIKLGI